MFKSTVRFTFFVVSPFPRGAEAGWPEGARLMLTGDDVSLGYVKLKDSAQRTSHTYHPVAEFSWPVHPQPASRSAQRALLAPRVSCGSLYRCDKST